MASNINRILTTQNTLHKPPLTRAEICVFSVNISSSSSLSKGYTHQTWPPTTQYRTCDLGLSLSFSGHLRDLSSSHPFQACLPQLSHLISVVGNALVLEVMLHAPPGCWSHPQSDQSFGCHLYSSTLRRTRAQSQLVFGSLAAQGVKGSQSWWWWWQGLSPPHPQGLMRWQEQVALQCFKWSLLVDNFCFQIYSQIQFTP